MKSLCRSVRMIVLTALLIVAGTGNAGLVLAGTPSKSPALPPEKIASGSSLQLLSNAIGTHTLVLLGEMHGTKEIPAMVGALVAHETEAGKHVILALEISSLDQAQVDRRGRQNR